MLFTFFVCSADPVYYPTVDSGLQESTLLIQASPEADSSDPPH